METSSEPDDTNRRQAWGAVGYHGYQKFWNPLVKYMYEMEEVVPETKKSVLKMCAGDPTVFGNMPIPAEMTQAVVRTLTAAQSNGYTDPVGSMKARKAIAQYITSLETPVRAEDVVVTTGCSGALDWCIPCMVNPGQNILLPAPQFPLYCSICRRYGIDFKLYNHLPNDDWKMDLKHMESLIDENTAGIVVNSPATPMGVVYSKRHLLDFLDLAEKYKLPVIADEIYAQVVFSVSVNGFHSLGSLSKNVPIISCCSISKRFLVPGWRLGWIVFHDRNGVLKEHVYPAIRSLASLVGGPPVMLQNALPEILLKVPNEFFDRTIAYLEKNATLFFQLFKEVPGLTPIMPKAAIYMMVKIDLEKFPDFTDEREMVYQLIREESVYCMLGELFFLPGHIRVLLTLPEDKIHEACGRIRNFCQKYYHQ